MIILPDKRVLRRFHFFFRCLRNYFEIFKRVDSMVAKMQSPTHNKVSNEFTKQ